MDVNWRVLCYQLITSNELERKYHETETRLWQWSIKFLLFEEEANTTMSKYNNIMFKTAASNGRLSVSQPTNIKGHFVVPSVVYVLHDQIAVNLIIRFKGYISANLEREREIWYSTNHGVNGGWNLICSYSQPRASPT